MNWQFSDRMIEYQKNDVERKFPYCDYEYIPLSDWSYAYSSDSLEAEYKDIDSIPFSVSHPPMVIKTEVKKINWGLADGYETVCAKLPESKEPISDSVEVTLHPYGCSKLRMTELPKIN